MNEQNELQKLDNECNIAWSNHRDSAYLLSQMNPNNTNYREQLKDCELKLEIARQCEVKYNRLAFKLELGGK